MNKLNIATFNLNENFGNFPNRIYELSNIIKKSKFDILCLQGDFSSKEFSSSRFLNLELDFHFYNIKNMTLLSKYELTFLDELFLYKAKGKTVICQFFQIVLYDYKFVIANVNLKNLNSKERSEQLDIILEKLKIYNKHHMVLMCGTFYNDIEKIKKSRFISLNEEFTHEDKIILDYIFYKTKLKPKIESKVLLKEYSNHYCLSNIFRF